MESMCKSGKRQYKFDEAQERLNHIQEVYGMSREKRIYWCDLCCSWHLTSQQIRFHKLKTGIRILGRDKWKI